MKRADYPHGRFALGLYEYNMKKFRCGLLGSKVDE